MSTNRLLLTLLACTAFTSCGDDAANGDGATTDTSLQPRREVIDTPSVPLRDTVTTGDVTTPEPEARKQMQEKFDTMGGMEGVVITFQGPHAVLLEGTVKTADRRQTAEDVARAVPGITKVENRISVVE